MVATVDALIFVFILALVTVSIVHIEPEEPDTPDASEVCDYLSQIALDGYHTGLFTLKDRHVSVWEQSAVSILLKDTDFIRGYLKDVLDDILGGRYGYELKVSFEGESFTVGEGAGLPSSECVRTYPLVNDYEVHVSLTIY